MIAEREMFYLGTPVVLVEEYGDGWCLCRWASGKTFRHWRAQITETPFGKEPKREVEVEFPTVCYCGHTTVCDCAPEGADG